MSFLFEDNVLSKLIVESGLFDALSKYGQQANDEAKLIAVKLVNNLMQQANDLSGGNDLPLYVQNLVDLDAYLSWLVRNQVRDTNGKLIVYHDATGASPPADAQLYKQYKEFYVLKDALFDKLNDLYTEANKPGNEVMKPLVQNLLQQTGQYIGVAAKNQTLPNNGNGNGNGNGNAAGTNNGSSPNANNGQQAQNGRLDGHATNVSYNPDDYDAQNSSSKNNGDANNTKQALESMLGNLPFQSPDALSPYAMHSFIGAANNLVANLGAKIPDSRTNPELSQMVNAMNSNYAGWNSFINGIKNNTVGGANATAYLNEVPYDRANRPFSILESIFGGQIRAKEACQRLLQMVLVVQQTVMSLNRSPQIVGLVGNNVLEHQLQQAKAFADSLMAYAR